MHVYTLIYWSNLKAWSAFITNLWMCSHYFLDHPRSLETLLYSRPRVILSNAKFSFIMPTCPCNVHPLAILKLGLQVCSLVSYFCSKNIDKGYTLEPSHNLCLEQNNETSQNISTENCHFYSHEKSLYVAWSCFRNICFFMRKS